MPPAATPPTLTDLPEPSTDEAPTLRDALAHHVSELRAFASAAEPAARAEFLRPRGRAADVELTLDAIQSLVASEHGFRDWAAAEAAGDRRFDRRFEAAVIAVVDGDLEALGRLLRVDPVLAHARSPYGHRATLLHYVAANGFEQSIQRSPANAPDVARMLLAAGADPDAVADFYHGACTTTLELLVSSSWPGAERQAKIVDVLCRGGARPNGLADDGAPLWTAITWGYTLAARRLVAFGAVVDNVIAAAVVGDVAAIESYFDAAGRLRPIESLRGERLFTHGRVFDRRHVLEYALIYAAAHDRVDAVKLLLSKNPDLTVREPVYGGTALGLARYPHPAAGRPEGSLAAVALLEAASR